MVTFVIAAAIVVIVAIVAIVYYCRRPRTVPSDTGNNEEDPSPKITRKPVPWDEDYDYDDTDQQRTVNLGDGVFKQYLNDDIYYLRFKGVKQDKISQNSNYYGDDEDYYY